MLLKEFTRQHLPPVFQALKATWTLQERLEVLRALKSIDGLQEIQPKQLQDAQTVEGLIKRAGLHKSGGEGEEYEWPKELVSFTDKGLKIWQYPTQFSKYLTFLTQFEIDSYLEIGVAYWGTFVFTTEYLRRFRPGLKSYCIDVRVPSLLLNLFAQKRKFEYITAKSSELYSHLSPDTAFDLVLVDGDHSKEGAMKDFYLVKDNAKIIAFHDIVNFKTPGAIDAWQELKREYATEYDCYEFIDQYDELMAKQPDRKLLGIGVAVKKSLKR